jgi:hypothetical protein
MAKEKSMKERLARYVGKWDLQPASYQIRNPDGTEGGWVPQVRVLEITTDALTVRPIMEKNVVVCDSKEEANSRALLIGLLWLENNA